MTGAQLYSVEVDGLSISYRELGSGPVLVLLHGFLCELQVLEPPGDEFEGSVPGRRLGRARSRDRPQIPPDTFTTASYAHSLAGFLNAIGIERAHIVGLSWGGILAQEFYRLYRERVRSLVLADTYAGWRGSLPEAAWKERLATCLKDADGPAEALAAKFVPGVFTEAAPQHLRDEFSAIVSDFHPAGFRLMSLSSAEVDTRDLLQRVDLATLLLCGLATIAAVHSTSRSKFVRRSAARSL